jgi:hypothetical protein
MTIPRARTTLAFVSVIGYIIITVGFFVLLYSGDRVSLPDGELGKQIIGMLGLVVGNWGAIVLLVFTFHYGTSQSSADKNEIIKESLKK